MSDSNCINGLDINWAYLRNILYKYINSRTSSNADTEDILQESLLKIYKNLDNIENKEKIMSWIFIVAKNTIIDFYRNKKSSHKFVAQYIIEKSVSSKDFSLDIFNIDRQLSICIKNMINELPTKYSDALVLTEYNGLTQKEMARLKNLSIPGAKSRVQRGRKLLKKMLVDCCSLKKDCYGNIYDYKKRSKQCKYC